MIITLTKIFYDTLTTKKENKPANPVSSLVHNIFKIDTIEE